jgi:hypothetical protein
MKEVTVLTPTGGLGNRGINREALHEGMVNEKPDVIASDAGSLDCGPWYLGAGREHAPITNIKWDIESILDEAIPAGIPVIIGSAGGSGARPNVDMTVELFRRVAKARSYHFKLAVIYSDVAPEFLLQGAKDGKVHSSAKISDGTPLRKADVEASDVIVGQMGVEPIIDALEDGADVIVAGRAVDAAVIAAYPIFRGFDPGLSYHMADIMECAESCAEELRPVLQVLGRNRIPIIGRIREQDFLVRPAIRDLACTPESCLMHAMYERSDVFFLKVPGAKINKGTAHYEVYDENTTRIYGTKLVKEPYSILFEGVKKVGYRSLFLFAVRTPKMIDQLDEMLSDIDEIEWKVFSNLGNFQIHWHKFGQNAVLQKAEPEGRNSRPYEVGVLADVVADSQELAHDIAGDFLARISFWRYPGWKSTAGNIAITLSPCVFDGGEVFELSVYHAVQLDDYSKVFKREVFDV